MLMMFFGAAVYSQKNAELITNRSDLRASIGYKLTERVGVFTEYYSSFINQFSPQHNLDAGIVYFVRKNIQTDFF